MQTAAKRILPVEDERVVARDLQKRLKNLGYEVPVVASSRAEANQVVEQDRPDLVLMDIRLNGIPEGIDAAREIREKFDIPVIYLTAHSDPQTLEQAKVTEPFGYLLKPFEDRELLATIEMALHKHLMEKRLREKERLINLSHDAIITTDSEGAITAWNSRRATG
jgi:CheY-like chemotaxis protein